jgi:phosphatidylinositol-3-phosphatase
MRVRVREGASLVVLLVLIAALAGCHREEKLPAKAVAAQQERSVRTPLPVPRNAVPPLGETGIRHVLVLILENGNPEHAARQPFMQLLAREGMVLNRFYALAHPSQPNYIALISGSTADAMTNRPITLDRPHIGQALGDRWKVYAEDYPALPGRCNPVAAGGPGRVYVRRHVPFLSFRDVQQGDCAQIVTLNTAADPVAALRADIANGTLPAFGLIIPNLIHDAHGVARNVPAHEREALLQPANQWMMDHIAPLLPQLPDDTIFILTFDEDDTEEAVDNRIFTAIWGKRVRQGTSDDVYNLLDLLATVAALLKVDPPPFDEDGVRPIGGVWQTPR